MALTHASRQARSTERLHDAYTPVKDAAGATVAKRYINLIPTIMVGAVIGISGRHRRKPSFRRQADGATSIIE
jgi:hypothetical protein